MSLTSNSTLNDNGFVFFNFYAHRYFVSEKAVYVAEASNSSNLSNQGFNWAYANLLLRKQDILLIPGHILYEGVTGPSPENFHAPNREDSN